MYGHGFASSDWLCGLGSFLPGPFGMILTLLFWGLVIFLVFKGLSFLFAGTANSGSGSSSAMEILSQRYAKGEITKTEFEQMKKDLA